MRKLLASLIVLAACSKGGIEGKLDEAAKLRDRMCACSDADCAKSVHEDYITWKKGNKKSSDDKPSEDQMKRWSSIHDEMMTCKHKLDSPAKP